MNALIRLFSRRTPRTLAVLTVGLGLGLALGASAAPAQRSGPPPPPPGGRMGGPMGRRPPGGPPPFDKIAHDLGVSPEKLQSAFHKLHPTPPSGPPTDAQRRADHKALASALHVSPARLEQVMKKYRPARRPGNGPPPPPGGPGGQGGFPGPPPPR